MDSICYTYRFSDRIQDFALVGNRLKKFNTDTESCLFSQVHSKLDFIKPLLFVNSFFVVAAVLNATILMVH